MAPVTNARTLFNEVPTGYPVPGRTTVHDTSQTIDLDNVPLEGGILIKTLVLSIDPYIRGRMRAPEPKAKSYSPPFAIGEPITNYGIGVVLRSEKSGYAKGDHVSGILPFQEYTVQKDPSSLKKLVNAGLPWEVYLGTLGMPGMQTAYYGWKEFSAAKRGETVFVTTAGGPVGSLVVELAKLDGLKVIGSAGSEEKVEFVRSLGGDVVFNYKTTSTREVLEREGPIDIYWDNVGGEILDLALEYANTDGRFIQCGAISMYNDPSFPGIRNYTQIFRKQLTMHGLLVPRLAHKYEEEFYRVIVPLVKEGKIKHKEDISKGLETASQGIADVQQGKNKAKKVILVAEE
ncbi:NAD-P-binding protein [Stereum hirsutum FP-91666 SS1]|uniref:NAD-P-binding protein n=1 Tax=Stereum hirsutum (strain FP-91666) TaxID=721885 RepID=UPI000444A91B|nr:NAD-P-binding protein [Stereum hirsutum FP-91666 SS1]EIM82741.1 NAD-P-binding protein [Stereum hirsutum FP-91666 SS1]